jgi:hypothetical protein
VANRRKKDGKIRRWEKERDGIQVSGVRRQMTDERSQRNMNSKGDTKKGGEEDGETW